MYVVKTIFSEDDGRFDIYSQVVFIGDKKECDEYITTHPDDEYNDEYYYEETKYNTTDNVPGMLWSNMAEVYPSTGKLTVEVDLEGNPLGNKYLYDYRHIDNEIMVEIQALLALAVK